MQTNESHEKERPSAYAGGAAKGQAMAKCGAVDWSST